MKRIVILALALSLALTGCSMDFLPYAADITTVELMRTMGLDKGEGDQVLVTVAGGKQGDEQPTVLSQAGSTIYSACAQMQTMTDTYIFYGHVAQCIVGEEMAREGVERLLDFLERDIQMRLTTKIFVVKGGTAADAFAPDPGGDVSLPDRLESIDTDFRILSTAYSYSVRDLLMQLEKNGCGLAPALEITPSEGEGEADGGQEGKTGEEGQTGETDGEEASGEETEEEGAASAGGQEESRSPVQSMGYAWFKDGALGGFLEEEESKGVNLLLNQVGSGVVECTLSDGGVAALRLVDTKCTWEPEFDGDVLRSLTAHLQVEADIAELRGTANPYDEAVLREMDELLSETLAGECREALRISQEAEADFLHLADKVGLRSPSRYRLVQENWTEWFPQLDIRVEVDGAVKRSYDVTKPMGAAEDW